MPPTPGISDPQVVDLRGVQALADPASAQCPVPLAVPDLVMRVRVGSRQLQVLRLLYTHRLLTAAQVRALAFETATRRTCEICLLRLNRKDWVVRAEPLHGGAGGGRSGYVYGLSARVPTCSRRWPGSRWPTSRRWPVPRPWRRAMSIPAGSKQLPAGDPASLSDSSRGLPAGVDGRPARAGAVSGGPELADGAPRRRGDD